LSDELSVSVSVRGSSSRPILGAPI